MKFIIILYLNHFLDFKLIFIYFTAKHTNLIIVNLIQINLEVNLAILH